MLLLAKCLDGYPGLEVPSGGVQSSVTEEDLARNLDEKLVPA